MKTSQNDSMIVPKHIILKSVIMSLGFWKNIYSNTTSLILRIGNIFVIILAQSPVVNICTICCNIIYLCIWYGSHNEHRLFSYNQLICIIDTGCALCHVITEIFNIDYTNVRLRRCNEALLNLGGGGGLNNKKP
jgi:hypothetical protein